MTVMEQIGMILTLARERGMTYGEYVSTYGDKIPGLVPDRQPEPVIEDAKVRRCKICGQEFSPEVHNQLRCRKCIDAGIVRHRKRIPVKIYERECTRCGAQVSTTQAPRRGCNLYCEACREIVSKLYRSAQH